MNPTRKTPRKYTYFYGWNERDLTVEISTNLNTIQHKCNEVHSLRAINIIDATVFAQKQCKSHSTADMTYEEQELFCEAEPE